MLKKNIYLILTLIVVGFFLYAFNFHNKLFWDDEDWIVNNPAVHNLSWQNVKFIFSHDTLAGIGLRSNYFRPVLFLTFLGNYSFGGTRPFFYHLTNNFIHLANALLIFVLLLAFLRNRLTAFLAALLFLIHPLQTEAVTYISGRGDPLSTFFILVGLCLFLLGIGHWPGLERPQKRWLFVGLAFFAQILAMLSRETAFLFPAYATIFLMAFVFRERFVTAFIKALKTTWFFWGASMAYGILRLTVLNFQNTLNFFQQSNIYTEHLSYRIYTFLQVILVYWRLIFVPVGLHMERNVMISTSFFQWPVWSSSLLLMALVVVTVKLYRQEKRASNPSEFRIWFFAWGFFFVNLAPTSGIFPINAIIYEHWLYFSLFGFFALLAHNLAGLIKYLATVKRVLYYILLVALITYMVFLGWQSIRRNINLTFA